jgi:hypothetical protein
MQKVRFIQLFGFEVLGVLKSSDFTALYPTR